MDKVLAAGIGLMVLGCLFVIGQVLIGLHDFDVLAVVQSLQGGR